MTNCAKQGYGDSLCGIYAVLNVLGHFEGMPAQDNDRQREIFKHLMLGADRLGYVDYHHITYGFEAFELIDIVKFIADKFGYAVNAELLEHATTKRMQHRAVIERIQKEGHAVVVYDNAADHWVALVGSDELLDSWPLGQIVTTDGALASDYGLIIKKISQGSQ